MKKNEEIKKQLFDIARQIATLIIMESTGENKEQSKEWKNTSSENSRLYQKFVSPQDKKQKLNEFRNYPLNIGWEEFLNKKRQLQHKQIFKIVLQYAAILALTLGIGYYVWPEHAVLSPKTTQLPVPTDEKQPQLILANGETINLQHREGQIDLGITQTIASNQNNYLIYKSEANIQAQNTETVYNEILVPRSGEYRLKLSDGTVVYLNSMTKLRYPARFTDSTRTVFLTGEAYFEVAEDTAHPFIVQTADYHITVLGTKFNVSAFQEENNVKTTLVKGKVCIQGKTIGKEIILRPNEQFIYNKILRTARVQQVDVSYDIAWKDGRFRFRDARLEEIMHTMERWYDVEVVYADPETKDYVFGLNFSRNSTIDPILRIFEENGKIKLRLQGKTLIISKGR